MKSVRTPWNAHRKAFSSGRWATAAVLTAGGVLMMAPQAQAAHWEMSWRPEGATGSNDVDWLSNYRYSSPYNPATGRIENGPVDFHVGVGDVPFPHQGSAGQVWGATSASLNGTVTIFLKWVQDYYDKPENGGTPVATPKMVVLHITGSATGQAKNKTAQSTADAHFGTIAGVETSYTNQYQNNQSEFVRSSSAITNNLTPNSLTIPLLVPDGQSEIEYSFPMSANASTGEVEYYSYRNPDSRADVYIHETWDQVGVAISSDIETSWYKWTGAVDALPNAYKQRDSTGALIN